MESTLIAGTNATAGECRVRHLLQHLSINHAIKFKCKVYITGHDCYGK